MSTAAPSQAQAATIAAATLTKSAPAIGIRIGPDQFALVVLIVFLTAFALTALGFAVAWKLDSASAFHAIVNLFLIPLWLLSGALFPVSGASGWIRVLMRINPLTYAASPSDSRASLAAAIFSWPAAHSACSSLPA